MHFVYSDLLLLYKTISNEEELGSFDRLFLYHTRDFTVLVRILSILIYRVYNKKAISEFPQKSAVFLNTRPLGI